MPVSSSPAAFRLRQKRLRRTCHYSTIAHATSGTSRGYHSKLTNHRQFRLVTSWHRNSAKPTLAATQEEPCHTTSSKIQDCQITATLSSKPQDFISKIPQSTNKVVRTKPTIMSFPTTNLPPHTTDRSSPTTVIAALTTPQTPSNSITPPKIFRSCTSLSNKVQEPHLDLRGQVRGR